ncbi:MAG TPA: DUF488 domain-containing protein [Sphingomicrobium sp.]|nr:DUF488 domain-containing protein [Sphingomicrobium sp.]
MSTTAPVFTIGHSTRTIPEFVEILAGAAVRLVIDVRTVPRSRTNPQYNADVLPGELEPHGIGYERIAELGGLRGRSRDISPNVNAFWNNRSFHNYADYALSDAFESGLEKLIALAGETTTAIMCSEAVWWRCHRRIIADYLLVRGHEVTHLMGVGRLEPASLTPGAVPADGHLTYPAPANG